MRPISYGIRLSREACGGADRRKSCCGRSFAMSKLPVGEAISHCTTIDSLQKALDHSYRHLLDAAKADWHRLFAGNDPADACVTVRVPDEVIAEELATIPRADFLPARRRPGKPRLRRRQARRS